jgi:hypothetical protein
MHNSNQILRLDCGAADITERNIAFTFFDDLNTAATSGSSTTAIAPPDMRAANRLGLALV